MAVSLILTAMLAACGYGGGCVPGCQGKLPPAEPVGPPPSPPQVVDVELERDVINMPRSLLPGLTVFKIHNAGDLAYYFEIRRLGTEETYGLVLLPGETGELRFLLHPGEYQAWCPFDRHAKKGLVLRLQVNPPQKASPVPSGSAGSG